MIDTTQSIQVIPVQRILATNPQVKAEVDNASRVLENYWRQNVGRYFSKSMRYSTVMLSKQDRLHINLSKHKTFQWEDAISVRYLPYQNRVHVYINQVFNPKDGQDYSVYLMQGYPEFPGMRYSPMRDVLIRDPRGRRKAMSAEPYHRWITEFLAVVDETMETLARNIEIPISEEAVNIIADKVKASLDDVEEF